MERIENYTAHFTRTESGYMAQLVEWPEVVTEGVDIDDARESLKDALKQMILAYRETGTEIPAGTEIIEAMTAVVD